MYCYHGSPNKFEIFDFERIRTNGTAEGIGFYFTNKKRIAKGYAQRGYLYTVVINGKKALSDNQKTLTRQEVEKILIALHKRTDFLSNYGDIQYEGYGVVLQRALIHEYDCNDTDTEIIGSLYNGSGENPEILFLLYKEFGYDHITSIPAWGGDQKVVVTLTNDIIKLISVEKVS